MISLIRSFVFIGRPNFHKNKRYEFACQLTEAITKEITMQWKIKHVVRFRMNALSTNTKIPFGTTRPFRHCCKRLVRQWSRNMVRFEPLLRYAVCYDATRKRTILSGFIFEELSGKLSFYVKITL